MLKKMGATRRKAFLAALEASGNVTLAAERAKVSRSWVHKARTGDPAFRAACEDAIWASWAALREAGASRPAARGWGHLDGMELVVRGSNRRRVQIARARPGQFSPSTENRFLAALQATCSVKAACAAAGVSKGAAYGHRRRWPRFAERWDAAVEEASVRLEFALAAAASNPFSSAALPEPAEAPPMNPQEMLHNLHMHQHRLAGIGKQPGLRGRPPSVEAVRDKVVRVAGAVARGASIPEAALARDRAAFVRRGGG